MSKNNDGMKDFNLKTETAKFKFWPAAIFIVAIPTTSPLLFITGLPLEPGDIGAVI